jgi:GTP:adenosylcobinamide-phosphate guanylyltransferase
MNSTTLIFPMAGKGTRFGGTFKPFLEVNSHGTFIE